MANSWLKKLMSDLAPLPATCAVVLALLTCHSVHSAELKSTAGEIHLESAGTEVDAITKQIKLPKVRIWQTGYEIQADMGLAKGLNFDDSEWTFAGNVRISTPQGSSTADSAVVNFVQNRITELHITGQPATFEQNNANPQLKAQGRAELIDYFLQNNSVRLRNNAWIRYGQNEFKGRAVVYDINNQRVLASPDEQQGERVHITITPGTGAASSSTASKINPGLRQP